VFPTQNIEYRVIDEVDFGNIHGMKYHFIKNMTSLDADTTKVHDFVYWGSDKRKAPGGAPSGDIRHKVFKQIYRDEDINSYFIGRFYGFKRDRQWSKMKDIVPILQKSHTTLCFNWMDSKATTSRYVEALACGVIPLVWQNYDEDNTFVASEFQRVWGYDEFKEKLSYIVNGKYDTLFEEIDTKFKKVLLSPEEYYTMFESLLGKNL
jgi:bisphosphoglycerate-independent phosphoglycerate mutase (AlkP superfamily)